MGVHVIVFVDDQKKQPITATFVKNGLPALVDAVHGSNEQYLKTNFPNSRFFFVSDILSMCTSEELDTVQPDFVVAFDVEQDLSQRDWICIERYLESLLFPSIPCPEEVVEHGRSFFNYETPAPLFVPPEIPKMEREPHYELMMTPVPERDTMLIQVEKPFCDLPYTVVIHNFTEKGLLPFFTDLFVSQTWGISRKDIEFLHQVWKHWDMEKEYGPLDLEKRLHEATRRCFPDEGRVPEPEPIVYRRPIENVLQTLQSKDQNETKKETDFWNAQRLRKRKQNDLLL